MPSKIKSRKNKKRSLKNSRKFKGGKLVGYGGNGCAYSPAFNFGLEESKIKDDKKHLYVSKIGGNIEEEFYKTSKIQKILDEQYPDGSVKPGWFPEEILCSELKENGQIPLPESDIKESQKFNTCKQAINSALAQNGLCALNSKKFDETLYDYYVKIDIENNPFEDFQPSVQNILIDLKDQAEKKLQVLHAADIFHLDIKPPNFALVNREGAAPRLYYFDWDLANFQDRTLKYTIQFIIDNQEYYFNSIPKNLLEQTLNIYQAKENIGKIYQHVMRRIIAFEKPSINDMKATLESVDKLMLISSFWFLYNDLTLPKLFSLLDDVFVRT